MDGVVSLIIDSRLVQFVSLIILTFISTVSFPYIGYETFFDAQAIFDLTYLGIPRFWDIWERTRNGTMEYNFDNYFPRIHFSKLPINSLHAYNYSNFEWDHLAYSNYERKSFFGPLIVSLFSFPWSFHSKTLDKVFVQMLARLTSAVFCIYAFGCFCSAVTRKYGYYTTSALTILTMFQFYFIFNLSRFVPNCLSLAMVLLTSAAWLSRRNTLFNALASLTVISFHSITVFLFIPMAFHLIFIQKTVTFQKWVLLTLSFGYFSFGPSIIDSFIYGDYVWTESKLFKDMFYNPSIDLGLSTLAWYTFIALPKYLLFSIVFVPFASRRCIKSSFFVAYAYLAMCSVFGYKNLDLVIYCFPLLNTCAANAIAITLFRIFSLKSHPESWLLYVIRRKLGYKVTPSEEFEEQEHIMDQLEKLQDAERERFLILTPRQRENNINNAAVDAPYEYEPVAPADLVDDIAPPPYHSVVPTAPRPQSRPQPSVNQKPVSTPPRSQPPAHWEPKLSSRVELTAHREPVLSPAAAIHVSFQPSSPTRSRQPPQSCPTNFLRRRGGLRKPHIPAISSERLTEEQREKRVIETPINEQFPLPPPRNPGPVVIEVKVESNSKTGSIFTVFVAVHLIFNLLVLIYYHTTFYSCFPGGQTIVWLNKHIGFTDLRYAKPKDIGVYVGKHTVQTGYTRFLEIEGVTYDRSPNIYIMASRRQRLHKYRNPDNPTHNVQRTYNYPNDIDFKVIYFVLDHVDHKFLATQCRPQGIPEGISTTTPPPIATIGIIGRKPRTCALSYELDDCALIKTFDSFYKVVWNPSRRSWQVITKPSIWIFRCWIQRSIY